MANLTPAQQAQVEKVKQLIAREVRRSCKGCPTWDEEGKWCYAPQDFSCRKADSILSIEGLEIADSEQTPPINNENDICNTSPRRVFDDTVKEMLKANFKKVIPKDA